jgi:hypothetical protein
LSDPADTTRVFRAQLTRPAAVTEVDQLHGLLHQLAERLLPRLGEGFTIDDEYNYPGSTQVYLGRIWRRDPDSFDTTELGVAIDLHDVDVLEPALPDALPLRVVVSEQTRGWRAPAPSKPARTAPLKQLAPVAFLIGSSVTFFASGSLRSAIAVGVCSACASVLPQRLRRAMERRAAAGSPELNAAAAAVEALLRAPDSGLTDVTEAPL